MNTNTVYVIFVNADLNEGRGPMVLHKDAGFFTSEDAAWDFADTLTGVQNRRPPKGRWRHESYPDVQVQAVEAHNAEYHRQKRILEIQIAEAEKRLNELKAKRTTK
jgi:hypothetical protein